MPPDQVRVRLYGPLRNDDEISRGSTLGPVNAMPRGMALTGPNQVPSGCPRAWVSVAIAGNAQKLTAFAIRSCMQYGGETASPRMRLPAPQWGLRFSAAVCCHASRATLPSDDPEEKHATAALSHPFSCRQPHQCQPGRGVLHDHGRRQGSPHRLSRLRRHLQPSRFASG